MHCLGQGPVPARLRENSRLLPGQKRSGQLLSSPTWGFTYLPENSIRISTVVPLWLQLRGLASKGPIISTADRMELAGAFLLLLFEFAFLAPTSCFPAGVQAGVSCHPQCLPSRTSGRPWPRAAPGGRSVSGVDGVQGAFSDLLPAAQLANTGCAGAGESEQTYR